MFAVLKTGGKQYKVASGDVLRVEKLAAEAGEEVQFNDILMVGDTVGTPLVDGAGVKATVIDQIKGPKTINFVKRRRKHSSQRKKGHRQQLTLVRITDILEAGADKSGIKAAVSGRGVAHVVSDSRAAPNKTDQAEMNRVVAEGAEKEKPAETAKPKAKKAKAAPKAAASDAAGDDLKQLSGVGPALEKKLHENGVTTFAQIAAWGADDIAEMDDKLSFKGRIEREGWVEQAKALVK